MAPHETLKEVMKSDKPVENLFLIKFSYDSKLILNYKAALKFLESIQEAEEFSESYSSETTILPLSSGKITIEPFSREEYYTIKTANLLKIPLNEFKASLETDPA